MEGDDLYFTVSFRPDNTGDGNTSDGPTLITQFKNSDGGCPHVALTLSNKGDYEIAYEGKEFDTTLLGYAVHNQCGLYILPVKENNKNTQQLFYKN